MKRPALDQKWGAAHAPMFYACRLRLETIFMVQRHSSDQFTLKVWRDLTKKLINEVFRLFANISNSNELME